jgi:hypothetical protein
MTGVNSRSIHENLVELRFFDHRSCLTLGGIFHFMHSRVLNPLALLVALVLFSCLTYTSCKKADFKTAKHSFDTSDIQARFFAGATPDLRVAAIKEKIYREEQARPFVANYVQWAGYPHWDKAIATGTSSITTTRGTGGGSSQYQVVYVPFTREDSSNIIGAILVAIITPRDTILKTVYRWQYNQLPFKTSATSGPAAKDMALFYGLRILRVRQFLVSNQ